MAWVGVVVNAPGMFLILLFLRMFHFPFSRKDAAFIYGAGVTLTWLVFIVPLVWGINLRRERRLRQAFPR
jgi:hypothetical protein